MSNNKLINRQPAVAGSFYSANKVELKKQLASLLNKKAEPNKNLRAIIVPHAGYVFSASIAAKAYNLINENANYERIFIIASSHTTHFNSASIYNVGNYITPFGEVEVDVKLATKLINENNLIVYNRNAHHSEHSIEVQLPFLQEKLKKPFKIVPIVIGGNNIEVCKELANKLKPYFNSKNLFVISTDFSHYPSYEIANKIDKLTANAICSNSTKKLIETITNNDKKNISNLSTSLCGFTAVLSLMLITENSSNYNYKILDYINSGDVKYGDKDKVVGYNAISVEKQTNEFTLSKEDKKQLLNIARKTLNLYITNKETLKFKNENFSKNLNYKTGAFVSLHINHQLRGCLGFFETHLPLYELISKLAISSATEDYRFSPVTKAELKNIEIEISVLTPMRKINNIDEIELGKHGIYIKQGVRGGTFLPQVATQTNWTKEEFLGHCSQDKAGLSWDGWKQADVYIYEAIVFNE